MAAEFVVEAPGDQQALLGLGAAAEATRKRAIIGQARA